MIYTFINVACHFFSFLLNKIYVSDTTRRMVIRWVINTTVEALTRPQFKFECNFVQRNITIRTFAGLSWLIWYSISRILILKWHPNIKTYIIQIYVVQLCVIPFFMKIAQNLGFFREIQRRLLVHCILLLVLSRK